MEIDENANTPIFMYASEGKYIKHCVSGFVPHMKAENAMKLHGLDREAMTKAVKEALK